MLYDIGGKYMFKTGKGIIFSLIFTISHLLSYFIVGSFFIIIQNQISSDYKSAIDYFSPFRMFGLVSFISQFLRGFFMGLILSPFIDRILKSKKSFIILFGVIFGVVIVGSVEPQPGTIEGVVYTITNSIEHVFTLFGKAVYSIVLILFLKLFMSTIYSTDVIVETRIYEDLFSSKKEIIKYAAVFSLFHVLTYFIVGAVFYQFTNYKEAMETMELFQYWRSLESPYVAMGVLMAQLIRGPLLAIMLISFSSVYARKKHGWFLLFSLLFGLTAICSPILIHEIIIETINIDSLSSLLKLYSIGIPEIFIQMLLFSIIIFLIEKKRIRGGS